jgi:hypothetical protein
MAWHFMHKLVHGLTANFVGTGGLTIKYQTSLPSKVPREVKPPNLQKDIVVSTSPVQDECE